MCAVTTIDGGIIGGAAAGVAVFVIVVMVIVVLKEKSAQAPAVTTPAPTVRRMVTPVAVLATQASNDIPMASVTAIHTAACGDLHIPVVSAQPQPASELEGLPVAVARPLKSDTLFEDRVWNNDLCCFDV